MSLLQTLHSYIKYLWKNAPGHKTTPLNADNLNHMENGIADAHTDIAAVAAAVDGKADKTDIAPVESSSTASQSYAIGDQFYYNGLLYKATAVINSGGTITPNGNCTLSKTLVEQIASGADKGSVSVTADGTKTIAQLLVQLAGLVDFSKLNEESVMHFSDSVLPIYSYSNGNFKFNNVYTSSNVFNTTTHEVKNGVGTSYLSTTGTNGTSFTNRSSVAMTAGNKITIIY